MHKYDVVITENEIAVEDEKKNKNYVIHESEAHSEKDITTSSQKKKEEKLRMWGEVGKIS